jgi:hypothetical protein
MISSTILIFKLRLNFFKLKTSYNRFASGPAFFQVFLVKISPCQSEHKNVRAVFSVTIPIDQFGKSEQFLTSFQNLILNDISSRHFDHFWQFNGIG